MTIAQMNAEKSNSCVVFFYDLNVDGCIGGQYKGDTCLTNGKNATKEIERELFGYRLNKKMVETRFVAVRAILEN